MENAANSAVAALSIIFGLSAAVAALLKIDATSPVNPTNDPHSNALIKKKISSEDRRSLFRLTGLHLVALLAIFSGVLLQALYSVKPFGLATKIASVCFGVCFCISILFAFFLPSLLSSLVKRNSRLN